MSELPSSRTAPRLRGDDVRIVHADPAQVLAYRAIRRDVFVREQGIFAGDDHDAHDDDPRSVVLVALDPDDEVVGGVRLGPVPEGRDIGWWAGSRLAVRRGARHAGGIGSALVREACSVAAVHGVLRFDAAVQERAAPLFDHLGWVRKGTVVVENVRHHRMLWPIDRVQRLATETKTFLGSILGPLAEGPGLPTTGPTQVTPLGGRGFVGDDGAPVPGSDVIAACDAILPALIEKDPEWAGWCAVLVNVNDLSAMGASPVGLLDAIGARTVTEAQRVVEGLRSASRAWGVPVLGGHTQLGVHPSLSVTALGRTTAPVPGGGGREGDQLSLTIDLGGRWRSGFEGRQWDSTSTRTPEELREMASAVARARPAAAKDVSMSGIIGTVGMLAEASGTGATLDAAEIPAPSPEQATFGDWVTCFPGFGMLTADAPGASRMHAPSTTTAAVGTLGGPPGVRLRWPDGLETDVLTPAVTGLGAA